MKRKTLFWILLFFFVALAAGGWYVLRGGGPGTTAAVYVDGELWGRYDLDSVVLPYEVTVETAYGYNTLRLSHGAVQVAEADCSEQVCVNQGTIEDDLLPIVCLPHHLVIQIEN